MFNVGNRNLAKYTLSLQRYTGISLAIFRLLTYGFEIKIEDPSRRLDISRICHIGVMLQVSGVGDPVRIFAIPLDFLSPVHLPAWTKLSEEGEGEERIRSSYLFVSVTYLTL